MQKHSAAIRSNLSAHFQRDQSPHSAHTQVLYNHPTPFGLAKGHLQQTLCRGAKVNSLLVYK